MQKEVVSNEVARQDVERWLEYKKIGDKSRDANSASIDTLADAVGEGVLVVEDDHTLVHKLVWPLTNAEGQVTVSELRYKPRLTVKEVSDRTKTIKANDVEGRVLAYVAALTGLPAAVLQHMDTGDARIAQAIAIFFF